MIHLSRKPLSSQAAEPEFGRRIAALPPHRPERHPVAQIISQKRYWPNAYTLCQKIKRLTIEVRKKGRE